MEELIIKQTEVSDYETNQANGCSSRLNDSFLASVKTGRMLVVTKTQVLPAVLIIYYCVTVTTNSALIHFFLSHASQYTLLISWFCKWEVLARLSWVLCSVS